MSKFQTVLIGLFIFLAVAGLLVFSLFKTSASKNSISIVIWGTLDTNQVTSYVNGALDKAKADDVHITYVRKRTETFDQDFIEALASGKGPDAILLGQDSLIKNKDKFVTIPYSSLSEQDFKKSFIQEAELYLGTNGTLALPFSVDPLVMYWNRDLFSNANVALPPTTWDQFTALASQLTKRDGALNITQSALALGEYRNITHAKDILSLLIMQTGNSIIATQQNQLKPILTSGKTVAALSFYTQFANPVKNAYSWNRSLLESKNLFLANKLGIYFGYASELSEIKEKNPNLNFGVATIPQTKAEQGSAQVTMTFGTMNGLSIVKGRGDPIKTLQALILITSKNALTSWSKISGLPSVRRDVNSANPNSEASQVFAKSALWSRAWLDPNKQGSNTIFQTMVENVTSGRLGNDEAVALAQTQMQSLINQNRK
jgi:ABC-type glycerol-3-phosphate transport system substrate-binding protein